MVVTIPTNFHTESDQELLELSSTFTKDVAEKEKAAKEIEEKLATLNKNKDKHESLLLSLKEQAGRLKSTIEVFRDLHKVVLTLPKGTKGIQGQEG